ncbi:MAG: hypothetical protein NC548_30915 [Lachnospiraceae bacterium]|nr:hypothetical protein [Lachnospiraceae bacterium]
MKHILSYSEFINEGFLSKTLNRAKTGDERIEDRLGNHSFTDGNGKFHKYGIKPKGLSSIDIANDIIDIILKTYKKNEVVDLNVIDMSNVEDIHCLFCVVYSQLLNKIKMAPDEIKELKFDTSGWVLTKCIYWSKCLSDVHSDIGADNWKINPDAKISITDFKDGYYELNLPKWYTIIPKEYIKLCCGKIKEGKSGVDKVRTKELGKKCYWVEFYSDSLYIPFVPDNFTIRGIYNGNEYTSRMFINCKKLTSLTKLPKEITVNTASKHLIPNVILDICLNNITDDNVVIPEGVTFLHFDKDDDISRLPKEVPYGVNLCYPKHLGHFERVEGDVNVGNSNISSLVGCPKYVGGNFDAHFCKITDLIGSPEHVEGNFTCSHNSRLKSLKGCPKYIGGEFNAFSSAIVAIDDFPEYIGEKICFQGDTHMHDLTGLPEEINNDLDISYCEFKSFEGLPKKINGKLFIKELTLNNEPATVDDILKVSPDLEFVTVDLHNNYNPKNLIKK